MGNVITVKGVIDSNNLGFTQTNEHLFYDLSWKKYRWLELPITDFDQILEEVNLYKSNGGKTIIDATPNHVGRSPEKLKKISEITDINIIMGCGYYNEPYYPEYVHIKSTPELANILINEINNGVGTTEIKPGIIGEIGVDKLWIQGIEERVIRACARASNETGLRILTHNNSQTNKHFLSILGEEGMIKNNIIFGNQDESLLYDDIAYVLDQGCYVQFSTIGQEWINGDKRRAKVLKKLINKGYEDQLLISTGINKRERLATNGGHGLIHIKKEFIPLLHNIGVSTSAVNKLVIDNPKRIFD